MQFVHARWLWQFLRKCQLNVVCWLHYAMDPIVACVVGFDRTFFRYGYCRKKLNSIEHLVRTTVA